MVQSLPLCLGRGRWSGSSHRTILMIKRVEGMYSRVKDFADQCWPFWGAQKHIPRIPECLSRLEHAWLSKNFCEQWNSKMTLISFIGKYCMLRSHFHTVWEGRKRHAVVIFKCARKESSHTCCTSCQCTGSILGPTLTADLFSAPAWFLLQYCFQFWGKIPNLPTYTLYRFITQNLPKGRKIFHSELSSRLQTW